MMEGSVGYSWYRSKYPLMVPLEAPAAAEEEEDFSSSNQLSHGAYSDTSNGIAPVYRVQPEDQLNQRPFTSSSHPDANGVSKQRSTGSIQAIEKPSQSSKCPVQHTVNPWTDLDLPVPPSSGEHEHRPPRVPTPDLSREVKRTLRRTQPSRHLNQFASDLPAVASPRGSPSITAQVDEVSSSLPATEHLQRSAVVGTTGWKRQAYPRNSWTDDSQTQDLTWPDTVHHANENEEASAERASPERLLCPVQAPPGSSNALLASRQSLESEEDGLKTTTTYPHRENTQDPSGKKLFHRHAYPLQSPISYADLRGSPTPPASPESEAVPTTRVHAHQVQESEDQHAPKNKTLRRQVYPLQSPASVANLLDVHTPPPSPDRELEASSTETVDHDPKVDQAPSMSKLLRRQVYPLQSPASIPSLRVTPPSAPSPPPPVRESLYEPGNPTSQSRENELAMKVISHWRRQVYPLQSPKTDWAFERSPTPQPDASNVHNAGPIHLPKNLRAARDAEKAESLGRTIIVCLDGTGDKFDNDNSNIVHLISALKKDDAHQVTYYQAGIGTYSDSGLSSGFSAAMDMAVGSGLGLHVRDAYHFLMHTYKEGDRICIFGFSRGAYTARCLGGMIHKVGLLPPRNIQQIPFAYEFYANDTKQGWEQSQDFKATFCIDVCVYFIGCFDSVASVGFIPRQLPLSSTPTSKPRYFRHAMALDERRAKFKICRHQKKDWDDITPPTSPTDAGESGEKDHPNVTDEEYQRLTAHETPFDTDVLEVWFVGAHADIGGGAVANDERHKLAQIPLRWMIRQAFECNTGIIFKTKILAEFGLDVHSLWPKYERLSAPTHGPPPRLLEKYDKKLPPRSTRRAKLVPIDKHEKGEPFYHLKSHTDDDWTPEQVEDFYDAMSKLNDQLVQAPGWWILEVWPIQYEVPRAAGEVSTCTGMNLGRYRGVEDVEPNLHWTVKHRMQHTDYRVQVRTAAHTTWRTVV